MDDANTNKQLRIYDDTGKFIRVSVDETIARNLNQWQGWKCSAGVRGVYIDYDGNVWVCNSASSNVDKVNFEQYKIKYNTIMPLIPPELKAKKAKDLLDEYQTFKKNYKKHIPATIDSKKKYPGYLGNINEGFDIESSWFTCPWKACGCGADVILTKIKDDKNKHLLAVTQDGYLGRDNTKQNLSSEISEPAAVEMNFSIPYQILWDLSRKCNYDCSYCWSGVHNRTDKHKPLEILEKTADKFITTWANNNTIRWNFGGGEPTLHPYFINFLKYLNDRNQWTMVTSNGTRDTKYWSEAVKYLNSINLSAHFDGLLGEKEEDRFIKNIQVICDHFDSHNDDHWLEIKIMSPPYHFDRALNLKKKVLEKTTISSLGANNRIKGYVSIVPIRSIGDSGKLVTYSDEQLEILKNQ